MQKFLIIFISELFGQSLLHFPKHSTNISLNLPSSSLHMQSLSPSFSVTKERMAVVVWGGGGGSVTADAHLPAPGGGGSPSGDAVISRLTGALRLDIP